jgi:TorA maturation chaperone TorD
MSTNAASQDAQLVPGTLDEETARAEVYGLLAALYYAPPGASLWAQLRVAVTEAPSEGGFLEEPWRGVVGAAREFDLAVVSDEYQALFGGVSKPEVYLFASHYLAGFLNEKPLAKLRTDLATLGLTRDDSLPETEDHIAYLCEVMRYLIAGDDVGVANLTRQREFFVDHLQPWVNQLCEAIEQQTNAHFYAALARFTRAFIAVEMQGFDMLS